MSSRALRKARRQLEEQRRLEKAEKFDDAETEASEDEQTIATPPARKSVFSALIQDSETDENAGEDTAILGEPAQLVTPTSNSKAKRKKKKKTKKKGKEPRPAGAIESQGDEDSALSAIDSLKLRESVGKTRNYFALLAVDKHNLQVLNEMRRLFGRDAVDAERQEVHNEAAQAQAMRGGRRALATNRLAALARRKNIFVQGKEEWPSASTVGMGMDTVAERADGSVEYRFVHSTAYQDIQRQFLTCVDSMDPQRLWVLATHNPYHIATLIQLSEIAKQYGERTTATDFLERALFSFGRAVHSTFATALAQGKARLDFRRPENREFGLTIWRYIDTLRLRATWRTVFEWARLLFSLDPENDPFCISLVLDQYAIRANHHQLLIDLVDTNELLDHLSWLPVEERTAFFNLGATLPLAFLHTQRREVAEVRLFEALERHPWVFNALFKELGIEKIPPSIWGKQAPDQGTKLLTDMYVSRAKDLWNSPEATSLLTTVAMHAQTLSDSANPAFRRTRIFTNFEALNSSGPVRHVVLTESRAYIAMLQIPLLLDQNRATDPLPPVDNLPSYTVDVPRQRPQEPHEGDFSRALREQLRAEQRHDDGDEEDFRAPVDPLDRTFPGVQIGYDEESEGDLD